MCEGCGCSRPTPPVAAGPIGPIVNCAAAGSRILLIDELGVPFANTAVRLVIGARRFNATTNVSGQVCLGDPPGTLVQVELPNTHEARPGDSTTTPSGRHFAAGGTGP